MRHECEGQQSLFDQAKDGRDEGMELVSVNTDAEWAQLATADIDRYLRTHVEFFVDDWWEQWNARGLPQPHNGKAIGPIIQGFRRRGLIRRSGRSRPSVRSHLSDKPVWISLVFGQTEGRNFA